MEKQEDNDPVWELLKSASDTKPGPFFSRNVVREVRLMEDSQGSFGINLFSHLKKRVFTTALAAAAVVAFIAVYPGGNEVATEQPLAQEVPAFDPASELEEVEYLGQMVAVTDPALLTDEALADLFF